jgi:hypothetical protein
MYGCSIQGACLPPELQPIILIKNQTSLQTTLWLFRKDQLETKKDYYLKGHEMNFVSNSSGQNCFTMTYALACKTRHFEMTNIRIKWI